MLRKSTSKQAFSQNVATEMNAGRPQKQAVAIAYAVKRKAGGKDDERPPSRRKISEFGAAMRRLRATK